MTSPAPKAWEEKPALDVREEILRSVRARRVIAVILAGQPGVVSGVTLAIWLSYALVSSGELAEDATYHVPWLQILIFAVVTYVASLAMTFIPARQAASIPTAEALRYE